MPLIQAGLSADEKDAELKWKFEKDKSFYQTVSTTTKQKMKVMGVDVNQAQTQTFEFSWTPKELKDKQWTIKQGGGEYVRSLLKREWTKVQ